MWEPARSKSIFEAVLMVTTAPSNTNIMDICVFFKWLVNNMGGGRFVEVVTCLPCFFCLLVRMAFNHARARAKKCT